MDSHKDAIEKTLRTDPLADAERITGASYKDDEGTAALGMMLHMQHTATKNALLQEMDDTTYSTAWPDFLRIIAEEGWQVVLTTVDPDSEFEVPDEQILAYHPDMHSLMVADSYGLAGKRSVNGGKFYFIREYGPDDDMPSGVSGGYVRTEDGRLLFTGDLGLTGGALRHNTAKLCSSGKAFTDNWPQDNRMHLWFYSYWEEKASKSVDFKDRMDMVVAKLTAAGLDPARFGL